MSDGTRERIVTAGADLMHRKGFLGAGLQEILEAAQAPRGSFYHYFKSKEAFALAVIDHHADQFHKASRGLLEQPALSPMARLRAYFERLRTRNAEREFTCGCPFGNLAQEMADISEPLRARLNAVIEEIAGFFQILILQGQEAGEVRTELDSRETAYFLLAAWQGTLIRMKAAKSADPIDLFLTVAFDRLLESGREPV